MPTTIRAARAARNLTLDALGVLTDLYVPFLSRVERGIVRLTPRTADRIGVALGVPATELLEGQASVRSALKAKIAAALSGGQPDAR